MGKKRWRGLWLLLLLQGCSGDAPTASYGPDGELLQPRSVRLRDWNVVLISIDTLRADHLGCYGYGRDTSPNIDRLARESILFESADSCSPWTTPAHISLMTSLYPSVHKVYPYPNPGSLDAKAVTLAEILRAQGYATGGFTEGGYAQGKTGLDHGFTTFPGWPEDAGTYISHELAPSRLEENAGRALRWLEENAERKFFLFFHTYEPHYPYRAPAEYLARLNPEWSSEQELERLRAVVAKLRTGGDPSAEDRGLVYRHHLQGDLGVLPADEVRLLRSILRGFSWPEWARAPGFREDLDYLIALYDAEILFSDAVVGRILDRLRSLNVYERTLIIVTSDHGEGFMEHETLLHGENLYQELLRVPLLLRLPGHPASGSSVASPSRLIDVLPTVLDALGLPSPRVAQGSSLLPWLESGSNGGLELTSRAEALTFRGRELSVGSLRRGRWKYIRHEDHGTEELYDLVADPGERNDVSARRAKTLQELRAEWETGREENLEAGGALVASATTLSEAERKRLESLGYLGQGSGRREATSQQTSEDSSLRHSAREALVGVLKREPTGTPVWFAVSDRDAGSRQLLRELREAFAEAGWRVGDDLIVPFGIRPGILVLAAEATPPDYVQTLREALTAAGLQTKLGTNYRSYYEEMTRTREGFQGFEMAPEQTYLVVLGRVK